MTSAEQHTRGPAVRLKLELQGRMESQLEIAVDAQPSKAHVECGRVARKGDQACGAEANHGLEALMSSSLPTFGELETRRYVEFRIMRSSFLDDGGLRAGS
jgi:hypothetical protein